MFEPYTYRVPAQVSARYNAYARAVERDMPADSAMQHAEKLALRYAVNYIEDKKSRSDPIVDRKVIEIKNLMKNVIACGGTDGDVAVISKLYDMCSAGVPYAITLSRRETRVQTSIPANNWKRIPMQEKHKCIRPRTDVQTPYLLRFHPVFRDSTAPAVVLAGPIPLVISPTSWKHFISILFLMQGYGLKAGYISATDAIHLAHGFYFDMWRERLDLRLVHNIRMEPIVPDPEYTAVAAKVAEKVAMLPAKKRKAEIDRLTEVLISAQITMSNELERDLQPNDDACYSRALKRFSADLHTLTAERGRQETWEMVEPSELYPTTAANIANGVIPTGSLPKLQYNGLHLTTREMTIAAAGAVGGAAVALAAIKALNYGTTSIIEMIMRAVMPQVKTLLRAFASALGSAASKGFQLTILSIIVYYAVRFAGLEGSTSYYVTFGLVAAIIVVLQRKKYVSAIMAAGPFADAVRTQFSALRYNADSDTITEVSGFGKLIVAAISLGTGLMPTTATFNRVMQGLKNANIAASLFSKFESIIEFVVTTIPTIVYELWSGRDPRFAIYSKCVPSEVFGAIGELFQRWQFENASLLPETFLVEIAGDRQRRKQFIALMETGETLKTQGMCYRKIATNPQFKLFCEQHKRMLEAYREARLIEGTPNQVMTPFVIYLAGDAGIGKSSLLKHFGRAIFGENYSAYARDCTDPYWSGYNASYNTVIFDDFCQITSNAMPNDDATDFMKIVTNNPVRLPMAGMTGDVAIGVKGTVYGSPLILIATNVPVPKSSKVASSDALLRRRNLCITAQPVPGVLKDGSKSVVDWSKVPNSVDPYGYALRFGYYDNLSHSAPASNCTLTLSTVMERIRADFIKHMTNELAASTIAYTVEQPLPTFSTTDAPNEVNLRYNGKHRRRDVDAYVPEPFNGIRTEWDVDGEGVHCFEPTMPADFATFETSQAVEAILRAIDSGFACPATLRVLAPCVCGGEEMHKLTIHCYPAVEQMGAEVNYPLFSKPTMWQGFKTWFLGGWQKRYLMYSNDMSLFGSTRPEQTAETYKMRSFIATAVTAAVGAGALMLTAQLVRKAISGATTVLAHTTYNAASQASSSSGNFPSAFSARSVTPVSRVGNAVRYNGLENPVHARVKEAMVQVKIVNNGHSNSGTGIMIGGRMLLVPEHFFSFQVPYSRATLYLSGRHLNVRSFRDPVEDENYSFSCENLRIFGTVADNGYDADDLLLIELPRSIRLFPNILGHIADIERHSAAVPVVQYRIDGDAIERTSSHAYKIEPMSLSLADDSGARRILNLVAYDYDAPRGACGSPIVTNYTTAHDHLMAVHIATLDGVSYGVRLVREHLQNILDTACVPVDAEEPEAELNPNGYTRLAGNLYQFGYSERQDRKMESRLKASILAPAAPRPTIRERSIVDRRDTRWLAYLASAGSTPFRTPLTKAVSKYANHPGRIQMDPIILAEARNRVIDRISRCLTAAEPRVQTVDEVLNGTGFVNLKPISLTSSAGVPYCDENVSRKDLVNVDLRSGDKTLKARLRKQLGRLHSKYKRLQPAKVVWKDFPKDELRKIEKIKSGSTRHITMPPFEFVILAKQYLGAFESAFKVLTFHEGTAFGIACESREWDKLVETLRSFAVDDSWWSCDFSNFDGSIPADVIGVVNEIVEFFYKGAPREDVNVRYMLFESMIHTLSRCDDLYYLKHLGNPSGCPITTLLNIISVQVLIEYAVLDVAIKLKVPPPGIAEFLPCCYGDDLQLAIPPILRKQGFDLEAIAGSLAEFGITLNSETVDKYGWQPAPIGEMVFLKRTNVFSQENNCWVPNLDEGSLADILNWTHSRDELADLDVVEAHIQAFLLFAYFRGKRYFEKQLQAIRDTTLRHYQRVPFVFFDYAYVHSLYMADKIDEFFEKAIEGAASSERTLMDVKLTYNGNHITTNNVNNINGDHNSTTNSNPAKASNSVDFSPDVDVPISGMPAGLDHNTMPSTAPTGERVLIGNYASVDQPVYTQMMSLQSNNFKAVQPEQFGVTKDEMNCSTFHPRWHRLTTLEWNYNQAPNTLLYTHLISPFSMLTGDDSTVSPMEMLARYATYWRGDLIVRVEFVATDLHSGKLFAGLHYGAYDESLIANMTLPERTGQYGEYLDLADEVSYYTFRVKYNASTPWLNTAAVNKDPVTYSEGLMSLSVVNRLAYMNSIPNKVDINIYVAAGENFMVHYPGLAGSVIPLRGVPWVAETGPEATIPETEAVDPRFGGTTMLVYAEEAGVKEDGEIDPDSPIYVGSEVSQVGLSPPSMHYIDTEYDSGNWTSRFYVTFSDPVFVPGDSATEAVSYVVNYMSTSVTTQPDIGVSIPTNATWAPDQEFFHSGTNGDHLYQSVIKVLTPTADAFTNDEPVYTLILAVEHPKATDPMAITLSVGWSILTSTTNLHVTSNALSVKGHNDYYHSLYINHTGTGDKFTDSETETVGHLSYHNSEDSYIFGTSTNDFNPDPSIMSAAVFLPVLDPVTEGMVHLDAVENSDELELAVENYYNWWPAIHLGYRAMATQYAGGNWSDQAIIRGITVSGFPAEKVFDPAVIGVFFAPSVGTPPSIRLEKVKDGVKRMPQPKFTNRHIRPWRRLENPNEPWRRVRTNEVTWRKVEKPLRYNGDLAVVSGDGELTENTPVMAVEEPVVPAISTTQKLMPREDDHFMENISDLRQVFRRFEDVTTFSGATTADEPSVTINVSIIDLLRAHSGFAYFGPCFRYMRGKLIIRMILNAAQGIMKARLDPNSYYPAYAGEDYYSSGVAIAYAASMVPNLTLSVPYLSSLHCTYTPWDVPESGSSYGPSIAVTFLSPNPTAFHVEVAIGADDDFRLGTFVGVPTMISFPGPPGYVLPYPGVAPPAAPPISHITPIRGKICDVSKRIKRHVKENLCTDVRLRYNSAGTVDPLTDARTGLGINVADAHPILSNNVSLRENGSLARRHLVENDWTVPQLVEREMYVDTISWDTTAAKDSVIAEYNIPTDILKNDIAQIPFRNFRFVRWHKLVISLQINGTRMHQGRLIAWCQPGVPPVFPPDSGLPVAGRYKTLDFVPSLDYHVVLNPTKSTTGELEIPFTHPLGYLHMGDEYASPTSFTKFMGTLKIGVFNPLFAEGTAANSVDINIMARFEKLEAKIPQTRQLV
jgi:hypothetical protein